MNVNRPATTEIGQHNISHSEKLLGVKIDSKLKI